MACSRRSDSGEWAYLAASPRLKGHASPVFCFFFLHKSIAYEQTLFSEWGYQNTNRGRFIDRKRNGVALFLDLHARFCALTKLSKKKKKKNVYSRGYHGKVNKQH